MIAIFLRVGAPTDWVFHQVLLDPESLTLSSVEWGSLGGCRCELEVGQPTSFAR